MVVIFLTLGLVDMYALNFGKSSSIKIHRLLQLKISRKILYLTLSLKVVLLVVRIFPHVRDVGRTIKESA